ncbi:MAG TPA: hypothetical protein VMT86_14455 [Bryobacteraceae bacterium]|nr:hypothetical protein [Bryobacteraceae bacterium]
MKKLYSLGALVALFGAAGLIQAAGNGVLVVTASNAATNELMVYNTSGTLVQTVPTQGTGGVSGNAGGIEAQGNMLAVVNYGSLNVSIFARSTVGFAMTQLVPTISNPVSVAFSATHLYVLGTTEVESHRITGTQVSAAPDGEVSLVVADGSAAQVGVLPSQLIIAEKSNMIETVNLAPGGAVVGNSTPVQNIPSNVNTPFGLVTSGNNAYVTIAHANEISLVRNGAVLTTTSSGTQMAPCWVTLVGPFLYSANSPSMSVSRYAVFGQRIVQVDAVAATFNGSPTDIASSDGLVGVIDGSGSVSHLSIFSIDDDGNLNLHSVVTINDAVNGVAVVPAQ